LRSDSSGTLFLKRTIRLSLKYNYFCIIIDDEKRETHLLSTANDNFKAIIQGVYTR